MIDAIAIIREVAAAYNIDVNVLRGYTGTRKYLKPRVEVYNRLRNERNMSYHRIGLMMGGRDHNTIWVQCTGEASHRKVLKRRRRYTCKRAYDKVAKITEEAWLNYCLEER